jgi:hypothetical protein
MLKFINVLWFLSLATFHAVGENDGGSVNLDDIPEGDDTTPGGDDTQEGGASDDPLEQKTMADAIAVGLGQMNEGKKEDDKNPPEEKPKLDADGKPLEADDAAKPKDDDKKPDADAAPAITDEDLVEPEGLSKKASERFQKLATGYKELQEELTVIRQESQGALEANQQFVAVMDEVGASPDSLNVYLDYMASIKTGNLEQAHKILSAELEELSVRMGKELPGVDLLKDHPDLLEDVDNFKITKERAVEIAKARRIQAHQEQQREQQQGQQQQVQATEKAKNDGLAAVDEFCKKKLAEDIDFKQKQAIIMESVGGAPSMLQEIIQGFPPNMWAKQLDFIYRSIKVAKPATRQQTPNPLRPSNGKGEAEPTSMQDAIFGKTGLNMG